MNIDTPQSTRHCPPRTGRDLHLYPNRLRISFHFPLSALGPDGRGRRVWADCTTHGFTRRARIDVERDVGACGECRFARCSWRYASPPRRAIGQGRVIQRPRNVGAENRWFLLRFVVRFLGLPFLVESATTFFTCMYVFTRHFIGPKVCVLWGSLCVFFWSLCCYCRALFGCAVGGGAGVARGWRGSERSKYERRQCRAHRFEGWQPAGFPLQHYRVLEPTFKSFRMFQFNMMAGDILFLAIVIWVGDHVADHRRRSFIKECNLLSPQLTLLVQCR